MTFRNLGLLATGLLVAACGGEDSSGSPGGTKPTETKPSGLWHPAPVSEVPEGMEPFMTIPPLSWHEGKLTVFYQRQYIDSAQRFDGAMRLTDKHIEALDMFDALADDPELNFSMQLQPGDMQLVYNHSQLHDRTGFTDWPEPDKRRHLLRLWLSVKGDLFRSERMGIKIK